MLQIPGRIAVGSKSDIIIRKCVINPALVWWGITNPSHIFCYAIMVFGNTVFFPPVYLHLI